MGRSNRHTSFVTHYGDRRLVAQEGYKAGLFPLLGLRDNDYLKGGGDRVREVRSFHPCGCSRRPRRLVCRVNHGRLQGREGDHQGCSSAAHGTQSVVERTRQRNWRNPQVALLQFRLT